ELMRANLGVAPADATVVGKPSASALGGKPLSAASPETSRLEQLRGGQLALEDQLTRVAQARLTRVEQAIRSFGLNPATLAGTARGQGGPFIPAEHAIASEPELRDLAIL